MSWPQIDAVSRHIPVVVPLGSCEQHGHHLPVSVDAIQVDAIARKLEAKLPEGMLLTQTLWLGSSHHHKDFPGTISVTPLVYAQIIQQIATSILEAGFTRILFLNGHGGNRVPCGAGLAELVASSDRADAAHLALASWWELGAAAIPNSVIVQNTVAHACEFETSLMLEIRGELVHMDRIQPPTRALENEWFSAEGDAHNKVSLYHRFHRVTAAGSLGNPVAATKEKGAKLVAGVVDELARFVTSLAAWPLTTRLGLK